LCECVELEFTDSRVLVSRMAERNRYLRKLKEQAAEVGEEEGGGDGGPKATKKKKKKKKKRKWMLDGDEELDW
jgi:hypothetical protein